MGPFGARATYTFSTAGDYRICAYLYSTTDSQGGPAGTPAASATIELQLIKARTARATPAPVSCRAWLGVPSRALSAER